MGLTRLRAEQISDIDYKQAVRVITITNVTLSGGAPSQVDGVNLSVGDRILVNGQNTGSQNGIYQVQTVGTGSNGTWIRSIDTNATGELEAGTIVMVTEGTVYKDTQWKLTTNNPIIIGTTALTFEQNSAFAFGNIFANGTAVLANTVGDVLTLTAGNNIEITGNNTAKSVTIAVTGISLNSISNGNSNVNVVSSGGNVTVGVGGTANVAEFSTGGLRVTGFASATGNITGGNLTTAGLISATGNGVIAGQRLIVGSGNVIFSGVDRTVAINSVSNTILEMNIANTSAGYLYHNGVNMSLWNAATGILSFATNNTERLAITSTGIVSAVGNIQASNLRTSGLVTATGNVTGGNIRTAGVVTATGNVTGGNVLTAGVVSATGNITGGNLTTAGLITATGNVTGGNLLTGGLISATSTITSAANVTGGNLITSGLLTASGNVTAGNIRTAGVITATGNIIGNYFSGNGSALTGINAFSNITVTGGNSVVASSISDTLIFTAGDGITIVANATSDTITISATGGSEIFVDGADFGTVTEIVTLSDDLGLVTEAVEAESDLGSIVTSGVIYPDLLVIGDINDFQVFGGNNGQYLGTAGNGVLQWQTLNAALTGDMIGNINGNNYSITSLSTLQATGNVTGGNVTTAGLITATGNVTGGNVLTGGLISATSTVTSAANVVGGNITTAGQITATGNVTGGNVNTAGLITATGNATAGNLITAGLITATGNATAGNLITAGLISATSTIISAANITGANLLTSGLITATGNITGGNVLTVGLISATGNISGGNLNVTGNIVDTAALSILSGANGNITLSPNGTGVVISTANTIPSANATYDLGSTTARWKTVFTSDLDLNNGIGDWTIVEGEDDLFLYNNKKGRVFKFALIEVDPATATPKIDGLK
jgi:filamentous hemagglutinin